MRASKARKARRRMRDVIQENSIKFTSRFREDVFEFFLQHIYLRKPNLLEKDTLKENAKVLPKGCSTEVCINNGRICLEKKKKKLFQQANSIKLFLRYIRRCIKLMVSRLGYYLCFLKSNWFSTTGGTYQISGKSRCIFRSFSNMYGGTFYGNSQQLLTVHDFRQMFHHRCLTGS